MAWCDPTGKGRPTIVWWYFTTFAAQRTRRRSTARVSAWRGIRLGDRLQRPRPDHHAIPSGDRRTPAATDARTGRLLAAELGIPGRRQGDRDGSRERAEPRHDDEDTRCAARRLLRARDGRGAGVDVDEGGRRDGTAAGAASRDQHLAVDHPSAAGPLARAPRPPHAGCGRLGP